MPFWNKEKKEKKARNELFRPQIPGLRDVKYIIAVASGKGGVGKSTVSTNLSLALLKQGFKVGLLDADIYGPSQTGLLGAKGAFTPEMENNQLKPVEKFGLKFMSMSVVSAEEAPVVWRAPMVMKMLQTFLNVSWGELDYLILDLPPGTGDIQLTLAQQASLSGAIIVSTPQDVALEIAKKGLKMFEQVSVPIIGIVENMSGLVCAHCGETNNIFKKGGAEELAKRLEIPFLGALPLDANIVNASDDGLPVVEKLPDSPSAKCFFKLAEAVVKRVEKLEEVLNIEAPHALSISAQGELNLTWENKSPVAYTAYELRTQCPCATCVDENTGKRILDPKKIPLEIKVSSARPVGRYGLSLTFSDHHNTGIYKFTTLKNWSNKTESFSV